MQLTAAARPVLKGELPLQLRRVRPKPARSKAPRPVSAAHGRLDAGDAPLFDKLREWRRKLAEAQGVPPYVIFHDSTLSELARLRPRSAQALNEIAGIGARKLERYGKDLLLLLDEAPQDAGMHRQNATLTEEDENTS